MIESKYLGRNEFVCIDGTEPLYPRRNTEHVLSTGHGHIFEIPKNGSVYGIYMISNPANYRNHFFHEIMSNRRYKFHDENGKTSYSELDGEEGVCLLQTDEDWKFTVYDIKCKNIHGIFMDVETEEYHHYLEQNSIYHYKKFRLMELHEFTLDVDTLYRK